MKVVTYDVYRNGEGGPKPKLVIPEVRPSRHGLVGRLVGWLRWEAQQFHHQKNFTGSTSLFSLSLTLSHTHTRTNSLSYHGISCLHSPLQTHTLSHANMFTHIISFSHTHIYSFSHSFLRTLPLFHKHTLTVNPLPLPRALNHSLCSLVNLYSNFFLNEKVKRDNCELK